MSDNQKMILIDLAILVALCVDVYFSYQNYLNTRRLAGG